MADIVIGKLKAGDTIIASTVLSGEKEYHVKEIVGNKAITDFRIFNTKIYLGFQIYEFGKRSTTNAYWLKERNLKSGKH
ncbi:MAG: hypothetical protein A2163_00710 [Actinobacteria bacterium RBG_13_35_12]|nr:MAG: hypothetical protein A2163_00710 [Actinobacteria bacterium RBG_13_35_12]